jgi:hypothetical protein
MGEGCGMMFHLYDQVWLNAGERGQEVIQDLLCGHPERPTARADLYPTALVAIIALSEVLGAKQDDVGVVG